MTKDSREKDSPTVDVVAAAGETDTTDGLCSDQEDADVGIRHGQDASGCEVGRSESADEAGVL
jgi:hypothetical protein